MQNAQADAEKKGPAIESEVKHEDGVQEEFFDSLQQFYKKPNTDEERVEVKNSALSAVDEEEGRGDAAANKSEAKALSPAGEEQGRGEALENKSEAIRQEEANANKSEVNEGGEAGKKGKDRKPKKGANLLEENPSFILKTGFQSALDKLSSVATKESGIKEGKALISRNNQAENLKVFINLLKEPRRGGSASEKDGEIVLLTYLLIVYKDAFVESLKNNGNSVKSPFDKVFELLKKYFKEPDQLVQDSCSAAVVNIYTECLLESPVSLRVQVLFENFLDKIILDGGDRVSKGTCCKAYSDLLHIIVAKHLDKELLNAVGKRLLSLFSKLSPEYVEVLGAVNTILMNADVKPIISGKANALTEKFLNYVNAFKENSKNAVLTKAKVEGLLILGNLATLLKDLPEILNEIKAYDQLLQTLSENCKDKRIPINSAASSALQNWTTVLLAHKPEALNQLKRAEDEPGEDRSEEEKKEKQSAELAKLKNLREMREKVKMQKQEELRKMREEILSKDVEDIAPKVVPQTRGRNFVKKRTGTGGGSTEGNGARSNSTDKQLKILKQMIINSMEKRPKTANPREKDLKNKESPQRPQTAAGFVLKKARKADNDAASPSQRKDGQRLDGDGAGGIKNSHEISIAEHFDVFAEQDNNPGLMSLPDRVRTSENGKKGTAQGKRPEDGTALDSELVEQEVVNAAGRRAPRTGSGLLKKSENLKFQLSSQAKIAEKVIERSEQAAAKPGSTRYKKKGYRQKSNELKEKIMEDRVFSSAANDIGRVLWTMNTGAGHPTNNTIKEEIDPLNEESMRNVYAFKNSNKSEIAIGKQDEIMQEFQLDETEYAIQRKTEPAHNKSAVNKENTFRSAKPGEELKEDYRQPAGDKKQKSDGFSPSMVVYREENESQNNFWKRGSGSFVNPPQNLAVLKARNNERERSSINFDVDDFFESALSADASKLEYAYNDSEPAQKNIKILNTEEAMNELEADIKFPKREEPARAQNSLNFRIKKVQPVAGQKQNPGAKRCEDDGRQTVNRPGVWAEALGLLETKNVNGAFVKVLQSDDDLYLLRLIARTGRCLKSLSLDTAKETSLRLCKIANSDFLSILGFKFLEEGVSKGLMKNLSVEDLDSVEELLRSAASSQRVGPAAKRAQAIHSVFKNKKE